MSVHIYFLSQTASFQKNKDQSPGIGNVKTEAARHNAIHEFGSVKSPTWKTSPEEDALEKLTANARNCTRIHTSSY